MNEQRVNELYERAANKIQENGLMHQNIRFAENEERENAELEAMTCINELKTEFDFLRDNWEVALDYSIPSCGFVSRKLRQIRRKISKVLLRNYASAQNNINYGNKQCWEKTLLYMNALQKENEELRKKMEVLTEQMEGIEEKMSQ